MKFRELQARLAAEGFNPESYHIGEGWRAKTNAYCIWRGADGQGYEIFYTERGGKSDVKALASESDTCDALYERLASASGTRAHCVGIFKQSSVTDGLCAALTAAGIVHRRDKVPYGDPDDLRFRVFVFGHDVTRAKSIAARFATPLP